MASEDTLTPAEEPGVIQTSEVGPESEVETQTTTEVGSQPDLDVRMKRLEANLAGTRKEWEKEKTAREKAEAEAQQYRNWAQQQQMMQQQAMQQQSISSGQSDDDMAKAEYEAIIEGNQGKLAEIRRRQRESMRAEASQQFNQTFQQLAQAAAQQQAMSRYLGKAGAENQPKIDARARQIAVDPEYIQLHGNDPRLIAIIAANEVKAELASSKKEAKESARSDSVDAAYTEGARSNGAKPGGTPMTKSKMVFSAEELRVIQYDMKRRGMTEDEAKKKYWNAMRPEQREGRLAKK